MKKEILKRRIIKRLSGMKIPQQRIVYSYAHSLLFYRKLRGEDLANIPMDRPAPGQIIKVLDGMLEEATIRELVCVLKFTGSVRRM